MGPLRSQAQRFWPGSGRGWPEAERQAGVRLPAASCHSPELSTCWLLPVIHSPGQAAWDFLELEILTVLPDLCVLP